MVGMGLNTFAHMGAQARRAPSVIQRAPTITDDSSKGYAVNNLWNSAQGLFVATDVTAGAAVWTPSVVTGLPLDVVPGATVAYGVKALSTAWAAGHAMDIIAADTSTPTINFISGDLDYTTLDAALAGTACKLTKLYDQSGNALDATQSTAAQRPVITPVNTLGTSRPVVFDSIVNGGSQTTINMAIPTFTAISNRANTVVAVVRLADAWRNSGLVQLGDGLSVSPQIRNTGSPLFTHLAAAPFSGEGALTPYTSPEVAVFVNGNATNSIYSGNKSETFNGGIASGSFTTAQLSYASGSGFFGRYELVALLIYPSVLSAANVLLLQQSLTRLFNLTPQVRDMVLIDGDSISYGFNSVTLRGFPRQAVDAGRIRKPILTNLVAKYGDTIASMLTTFTGKVTPNYSSAYGNFIVTNNASCNDITSGATAAAAYANMTTYVANVKALGSNARAVVCTLLPQSALTAPQQTAFADYNTLVRANSAGADAIADFQADPTMGPQAAASNAALYPDGIHPSDLGNSYLAPIWAAAVNSVLH